MLNLVVTFRREIETVDYVRAKLSWPRRQAY